MGWHRFTTASIDFQSPTRALAESYMLGNAAARLPDQTLINCPDNIRYVDIWEEPADGMWRMAARDLVLDWNASWAYSGRADGLFMRFCRGGETGSIPSMRR